MIKLLSYLLLAVSFCFSTFITGCNSPLNQPVLPGDYFPLTTGSSWVYQGEGNEYAAFKREVLFNQDNLSQLTENNGGTIITAIFETTDNSITRIYFEPESYNPANLLENRFIINDNTIILKSPIKVGTAWGEANEKKEIIDITAKVDTPAQLFEDCIKIKITYPDSIIYEYYHRGIGLVKREFQSGNLRITSTLEKYEIK